MVALAASAANAAPAGIHASTVISSRGDIAEAPKSFPEEIARRDIDKDFLARLEGRGSVDEDFLTRLESRSSVNEDFLTRLEGRSSVDEDFLTGLQV